MHHVRGPGGFFKEILRAERFNMKYPWTKLVRVSPERHRRHLWRARLSRLWKGYLRLATALAGAISVLILTIQYFILLPPFAWPPKRAPRRGLPACTPASPGPTPLPNRPY